MDDAGIDLGGSSSLNLQVSSGGRCDGAGWASLEGRLLELEAYADHDAVMDSWDRLGTGVALLARARDLLRAVDAGPAGRRRPFANQLEPTELPAWTRRAAARIRGWGPTAAEAGLAAGAERLAELVADVEADLVPRLPHQLVHGDFWTTTCCSAPGGRCCWPTSTSWASGPASTTSPSPCAAPPRTWAAEPVRRSCAPGWPASSRATTAAWRSRWRRPSGPPSRRPWPARPWPRPWGWVARLDDPAVARRHAARAAPEEAAALRLLAELDRWRDAFG